MVPMRDCATERQMSQIVSCGKSFSEERLTWIVVDEIGIE
jgi:hypothetical protein